MFLVSFFSHLFPVGRSKPHDAALTIPKNFHLLRAGDVAINVFSVQNEHVFFLLILLLYLSFSFSFAYIKSAKPPNITKSRCIMYASAL